MAQESKTVVFLADHLPVIAVLTLVKVDATGRLRSHVSVRAATPQPIDVMTEAQAVWQDWIRSCVDGQFPVLPTGWRVSDGGREALTPRPPNHRH